MRPMPVHRGALKEHIKNTQHLRCKITLTKTNQKKKNTSASVLQISREQNMTKSLPNT